MFTCRKRGNEREGFHEALNPEEIPWVNVQKNACGILNTEWGTHQTLCLTLVILNRHSAQAVLITLPECKINHEENQDCTEATAA